MCPALIHSLCLFLVHIGIVNINLYTERQIYLYFSQAFAKQAQAEERLLIDTKFLTAGCIFSAIR